ncbi:MAG TPA: right-handed parallel beta-helix repeat-containing protein, partial [Flavobacteriales bacterium]
MNPTLTGTSGGSYTAAPAGLSIDGTSGQLTPATSTPGTYTVHYQIAAANGCSAVDATTSVTITAPPTGTFSYGGGAFCNTATPVSPTSTLSAGGTFSSTPAGLTLDANTGVVTPSTSTGGSYTVTYTVPAAGGCSVYTTDATVSISISPAATIVYSGTPYCQTGGTATVTRTGTLGGMYSATPAGLSINAGNGSVVLGTSAVGTYTVTYAMAAVGACPAVNATTGISVNAPASATISYAGQPFCNLGSAAVTFSGSEGGTYSADPAGLSINSSSGAIDLAASTPGTYDVSYTVDLGCGNFTDITTVQVNPYITLYADVDGDGNGDPNAPMNFCSATPGYVVGNTDLCPTDPNKVSPGTCGCLVAETACVSGCADAGAINYDSDANSRFGACLYCGTTQGFSSAVNTAIAQAPDTWYRDRYVPAGFTSGVSVPGGTGLVHSISAADCETCRPAGFTSSFYNTQGRKYDLPARSAEVGIAVYVPSAWSTTGRRMAGLWTTGVDASNAVSAYGILEFTSDGGNPRFRAYNNGVYIDLGLPTGFSYDSWVSLRIVLLPSGELLYEAGDRRASTTALAGYGTVRFSDVILQGHNTLAGVSYDIHWDDLYYDFEHTDSDGDDLGDACDACPLIAGGAVHNVQLNADYCTIQAAVNAASPGQTIQIPGAVYNERVTIDKSLTLVGASETGVIVDGTGLGIGSGITINSGVTNVSISGLTVRNFQGAGPNSYAGIYAIGGNNNLSVDAVTLKDNVGGSGFYANGPIDAVTLNNLDISGHTNVSGAARGIVIWNGLKSNVTITNCEVYNNNCCGIELQDGTATGVTMSGNNVHDNGDNGIGLVGLTGPGVNHVFNNDLTNNGRFGIEIKNPNSTGDDNGAGSTVIENNDVVRNTAIVDVRDIAGISVYRRSVTTGADVPTGVVVRNNTVSGYTQSSNSDGFGIVVEGTNHSITGNAVSGCDVGIQRQAGHTPYSTVPPYPGSPIDGDQSNISDLYFGRGNAPVACGITVSGNTLSGNGVDERDVLPAGVSMQDGLVINTATGETFCTIQAAIDDAQTVSGNTILISDGTYIEDVTVTKSGLTIVGESREGTIVEGTYANTGGTATFYIHSVASNTTLRNLTVSRDYGDWYNSTKNYGVLLSGGVNNVTLDGLHVRDNRTGVYVENNAQVNLFDSRIDMNRTGVFLTNTVRGTIHNNIISDNQTHGVLYVADAPADLSGLSVNDN